MNKIEQSRVYCHCKYCGTGTGKSMFDKVLFSRIDNALEKLNTNAQIYITCQNCRSEGKQFAFVKSKYGEVEF